MRTREEKREAGAYWHHRLQELMATLGFENIDHHGTCFGVAGMGIFTILCNDLESFNDRLNYLFPIEDENELPKLINNANDIFTKLTKEAKSEAIAQLKGRDNIDWESDSLVPAKQNQLYELLQAIIAKKISQTPELEKQRFYVDLGIFLYAVNITMNPHDYLDILDPSLKTLRGVEQNIQYTLPLVIPRRLESQGTIAVASKFCGIYTLADLVIYFKTLREAMLKSPDRPVALLLGSFDHAISVGYSHMEHGWIYIDANGLPGEVVKEDAEIAYSTQFDRWFQF